MSQPGDWWSPVLRFSARSDIGMRRTNNQDSHREVPAATRRLWRTRGHLFTVADGMGAHAAGELASQMATEIITQSYLKRTDQSPYDALRDAILDAHQQIKRQGNEDDAFRDMGTTADVLLLLPEGALVGHIGDSRVYRLRAGVFEQLTFDHSLVWEVRRSGRADAERLACIPKNVITRSLGPTVNPVVDLEGPFPVLAGDTYLLCSDGLSGQVTDAELAQILLLFSPGEATESLVNLANLRGGPDNVTMIVVNVLGIPDSGNGEENEVGYEKRPSLSTWSWSFLALAIGLALLLTVILSTGARFPLPVGLSLGALAIAMVGVFIGSARKTLFFNPKNRPIPSPLGKGPYVRLPAVPDVGFVRKLSDISRQLQEALKSQNIDFNWGEIDRLGQRAVQNAETQDYGGAITSVMKSINLQMAALKKILSREDRS